MAKAWNIFQETPPPGRNNFLWSLSSQFSSVQSLSRVRLFATPWIAARQASLSITNSQSLPKLMLIDLVMTSNHLILCHPLLLLPSIFPDIRVFSNESAFHIRWPKYWRFSFNISPSNEYSELISFMIDWLDLLAVQETVKSLLQHHSSKASCSVFFFFNINLFILLVGELQYCIGFAIYQQKSATGIHVFPILNHFPSSLPVPSLWVISVHQPQASSIMHQTWTGDSFHIWIFLLFLLYSF